MRRYPYGESWYLAIVGLALLIMACLSNISKAAQISPYLLETVVKNALKECIGFCTNQGRLVDIVEVDKDNYCTCGKIIEPRRLKTVASDILYKALYNQIEVKRP